MAIGIKIKDMVLKILLHQITEAYMVDRDALDIKHLVRVSESAKERLGKKFGTDKFGRVNAHFADLYELEMLNGESVYEGYINEYIEKSDKYIKNHPQEVMDMDKIHFLFPVFCWLIILHYDGFFVIIPAT
jgi:hypothetical protein